MQMNKIIQYYSNLHDELTRHSDSFGVIQEARTKKLISRYLATNTSTILDVGGAGGVYAFFLADLGYQVTLLDIVPKHIEHVRNLNAKRELRLTDIVLCDALTFETDRQYDMILLHGPLYHLVRRADRVSLLSRMRRILSPNGLLLGFGINRYASYFYGVHSGQLFGKQYRNEIMNEVKSGERLREPGWYFHKAKEIVREFEDSALDVIALKSVTTQIWMSPGIDLQLRTKSGLEQVLSTAEQMEDEVEIGQDLLCVGKSKDLN